jgi:hypothetical protein
MFRALCSEAKRETSSSNSTRAVERVDALYPSAHGNQAMLRMLQSSSGGPAVAPTGRAVLQRKCAECEKEEKTALQRSPAGSKGRPSEVPSIVHEVLRSPGQPLDRGTRAFMEPRFGRDLGGVRIHTGAKAAQSADAVNAAAYTVGRDIVFGHGGYSPGARSQQELMAHELTHVVQQGATEHSRPEVIGREDDAFEQQAESVSRQIGSSSGPSTASQPATAGVLQRTPARKVSCAPGPLHLPGGGVIDDPVAMITAAENTANALLDQAISELDFTRQQILGGAPISFPTISDALAFGLRLMGLDANSERVWRQPGSAANYTVELLLRRLRAIRGVIGSGSFFFTCLGPATGTIGTCAGDICANAEAVSCAGTFLIDFCEPFWTGTDDNRAARIIHESSHNFAEFIGDRTARGSGTAECYARFAQVVGGTNIANQRTDLCPDPP